MKYVSLENLVELLKVSPEDILIVIGEIRNHIKGCTRTRYKQLYLSEKAVSMIKKYLSLKGSFVKQKVSELVNRNPVGVKQCEPHQLLKMLENSNRELFGIRRELVESKNLNQLYKDEISLLLIENHRLLDQEISNSKSVATNLHIA
ncbi:hypothetical protein KAJ27_07110 [bacterium]|nr:hypothetical protein [bacterium]